MPSQTAGAGANLLQSAAAAAATSPCCAASPPLPTAAPPLGAPPPQLSAAARCAAPAAGPAGSAAPPLRAPLELAQGPAQPQDHPLQRQLQLHPVCLPAGRGGYVREPAELQSLRPPQVSLQGTSICISQQVLLGGLLRSQSDNSSALGSVTEVAGVPSSFRKAAHALCRLCSRAG